MPRDADSPAQPSRWRRPLFLTGGMAFLALGAYLNLDRVAPAAAPSESLPRMDMTGPSARSDAAGMRHMGEEGKMGRPSAKHESGLYAMKEPANAAPQMARRFDADVAAGNAGILGQLSQESGHFLAASEQPPADEAGGMGQRAAPARHSPFVTTEHDARSTFSIDVDTASYARTRRFLLESAQLPPPQSVRTEELINYFEYDYPQPERGAPFSVTTEVGPAPWNPSHRLVHVGIQGKTVGDGTTPPRNLVFLIDVSGSMASSDKLPLVRAGLHALVEQMRAEDRISLVVYAGAAGTVLDPTPGDHQASIIEALDRLEAGGSTNGGQGLELAYALAERAFIPGGINRVILASDGDFNVGVQSHDALVDLIETKRESGVFLSVLGVGTDRFNDATMEQIADKGNGNYAYIDGPLEAQKVLVEESAATLQTIAKDVKIQVEFDPAQVLEHRLIGYENRVLAHRDFDDDTKDAGEIGAGHSVTALYEVIPAQDADGDLMTVSLRYKQPTADTSTRVAVPVRDLGLALDDTSGTFRFAAAVAMFGQKLRGNEAQAETTYRQVYDLAQGALGADRHCYRTQFLSIVARAGALSDERLDPPAVCTPKAAEKDASGGTGLGPNVLEVLRLLPPFLALPMFVMAFRRPRRRS